MFETLELVVKLGRDLEIANRRHMQAETFLAAEKAKVSKLKAENQSLENKVESLEAGILERGEYYGDYD